MRNILSCIKNFFINIAVFLIGIFIRRDKQVLLFGAWMGERFADNSRFLFQYIHDNKESLNLKRVIWVSRNEKVVKLLRKNGYEAYLMNSKEGYYWHLKSGVHFICNMYTKTGRYKGDIIGELSLGAKKVQLWHGVGVKAVANMVHVERYKSNKLKTIAKSLIFGKYFMGHAIFSAGGWKNCYHLTTSKESTRVAILDYGVSPKHIIEANYPRENDNMVLVGNEAKIIRDIKRRAANRKIVLYCPTFREVSQSKSGYVNPTEDKNFVEFLEKNGFLWVEKRHSASNYKADAVSSDSICYMNSDFDINILYKDIDLLITDYSSASSDCIFRGKKVVSFIPDYDEYENVERGFVNDYDKYFPQAQAHDMSQLKQIMKDIFYDESYKKSIEEQSMKIKKFLFADNSADMGWIYQEIMNTIF